jgi:hypothetical protein
MKQASHKRANHNPNASADVSLNPCFLPGGEPVPSGDLPAVVRGLQGDNNKVLLSISGKDSLAAWLFLREHNFDVIPYFCYAVPGLSYDVDWIGYLENKLDTKIYRYLHPNSAGLLADCCYQVPERVGTISRMGLFKYDFAYLETQIKDYEQLPPETFSAVGIRAKDNMMRNRLVHQMGPLGLKRRRYWWCVWDFSQDDTMAIIRKHGMKLSAAYRIWGATGDVIDYPFLKALQAGSPDDFRKFVDFYPLIEAEFFRYEGVK